MNDEYQKMSELLDNWLSDNEKETKLAFIEKEILLEKLRKLYVKVSAMETEEYKAAKPEPKPAEAAPEPKKQFTPAKALEEDVDLFFDTEHESYAASVEEDLKTIAEEINEAQEQPVQETEPTVEEPDMKEEEDFVIEVHETSEEKPAEEEHAKEEHAKETVDEELHAEDDILQFIPPKSAPAQPKKETPTPAPAPKPAKKEIPEPQPVAPKPAPTESADVPEPKQESPLQRQPQRSLNDLFNERREDHSISSQYQRAKVGDLTKAISINDKFIYIKELFHNRGEDFGAAIRQLNECQNMEEAFNCLDELKKKYFWDSKSDAYLSFCDLLRRKYS